VICNNRPYVSRQCWKIALFLNCIIKCFLRLILEVYEYLVDPEVNQNAQHALVKERYIQNSTAYLSVNAHVDVMANTISYLVKSLVPHCLHIIRMNIVLE